MRGEWRQIRSVTTKADGTTVIELVETSGDNPVHTGPIPGGRPIDVDLTNPLIRAALGEPVAELLDDDRTPAENKAVDLMAALEASVNAAKAARLRRSEAARDDR